MIRIFTNKVKIAPLINSAIPIFLAILISYSVFVECYSLIINFIIVDDKILFINDTISEAKNPRKLIITLVVVGS